VESSTGVAASAASASPFFAPPATIMVLFCGRAFLSAAKSTVDAQVSQVTVTSPAASRAASGVSATTSATGWPC
jgi:hypothetical protein